MNSKKNIVKPNFCTQFKPWPSSFVICGDVATLKGSHGFPCVRVTCEAAGFPLFRLAGYLHPMTILFLFEEGAGSTAYIN